MLAELVLNCLGFLLKFVLDLFALGEVLNNFITFLEDGDELLLKDFYFLFVLDAVLTFEGGFLFDVLIFNVHFVELLVNLLHLLVKVFNFQFQPFDLLDSFSLFFEFLSFLSDYFLLFYFQLL